MPDVKVGDRVRCGGSHARDIRDIPPELLEALQNAPTTEDRATARADIEAIVARPDYVYGTVIGFEPSPREGDPPRVQVQTTLDSLIEPTLVEVKMVDGIRMQPRATAFSTYDAADVEKAN
jgi:hypothetical protein